MFRKSCIAESRTCTTLRQLSRALYLYGIASEVAWVVAGKGVHRLKFHVSITYQICMSQAVSWVGRRRGMKTMLEPTHDPPSSASAGTHASLLWDRC
jgi:hypothetical protein